MVAEILVIDRHRFQDVGRCGALAPRGAAASASQLRRGAASWIVDRHKGKGASHPRAAQDGRNAGLADRAAMNLVANLQGFVSDHRPYDPLTATPRGLRGTGICSPCLYTRSL